MLNVNNEDLISTIRSFTGFKLPDPENIQLEINVAKLLPKIAEFIAHEKDEAINLASFLERLDAFAYAIPAISFEGGSTKQKNILEKECLADENVLDLAVEQLQTIADDLKSQLLGSSALIDDRGTAEPEDNGKLSSDQALNPESDKNTTNDITDIPIPEKDSKPLTWRDSIERKKDDKFDKSTDSDDWKRSIDIPKKFDTGAGNAWKESIINDFGLSDFDIARSAQTDFDRDTEGDVYGYRTTLSEKIEITANFLDQVKKIRIYFRDEIKPGLGY